MSQIYEIRRDEVCVGKVITDFEILKNAHSFWGKKIDFSRYTPCRSMLFTETQLAFGKYAYDLLYDSPIYPIYGKCDDVAYSKSAFLIKDAENIGEMLKYYGVSEVLTLKDMELIRKIYFNGLFPVEHLYDFGLMEVESKDQVFYDNKGHCVSDPKIIKEAQRRIKIQEMLGLRQEFIPDPEIREFCQEFGGSILDPKYFELLRTHGNKSIFEVLYGYEERMNTFKPHKAEGPIRALKKHN